MPTIYGGGVPYGFQSVIGCHGCLQCQARGSELALTPGVLPSTSPHEVSTAQPSRSREALSTVPPPGAGMQTSCDRGTVQPGRGVDIVRWIVHLRHPKTTQWIDLILNIPTGGSRFTLVEVVSSNKASFFPRDIASNQLRHGDKGCWFKTPSHPSSSLVTSTISTSCLSA